MSLGRPPVYRFAGFQLDMARRQLYRDGVEVPLRSKDFEVLALLVEHHDRAVSKDELFAHVWPGQIVDDNNLPRHISTLRRMLSSHGGDERCIQTLPGWGYRLAVGVSRVEESRASEAAVERVDSARAEVPLEGETPALAAPPTPTPPAVVLGATGPGVSWRAIAGAAVAVAVLAATGVIWFARDTTVAGSESTGARSLRQMTWDRGQQDDPAWSPDGRSLAFASDQAGSRDIYRLDLDTGIEIRLIHGPGHDWQPAWSPDGRFLAFRSERDDGGIYLARADGTAVRRLLDFGYRPQWAPDGAHLLVSTGIDGQGEPALPVVVRADSGAARRLGPERLAAYRSLQSAWHPDGRRIFVWGRHPDLGWRFLSIDAHTDEATQVGIDEAVRNRIESLGLVLNRFVWAPSGRFLYFEGVAERVSSVWRIGVDAETGRWLSGPDRLTTGAGRDQGIALSPDGTRLAFGILSFRRQVWSLPLDAATGHIADGGRPIDLDASDPVNLSVARDGRRLVYRTVRGGASEIRARLVADGREDVVLTAVGASPPHLSLDGTRLAYTRAAASPSAPELRDVVVRAMDGGAERAIARLGGRLVWSTTDWTPDGRALVGTCREPAADARSKVCVMPIDGAPDAAQHVQVLASDPRRNLFVPRFSPDMRWISFIASDAGRSTVYVMPARGGPLTALTDGRFQEDKLRWAPDSSAVYFVSNRSGFLNVWMRRIDALGQPDVRLTQVTDFTTMKRMLAPVLGGFEFAVLHNQLVLPLSEAHSRVWILDGVDR